MSSTTEKCREILLRLTKAIETIDAYKCRYKDDYLSKKRHPTPGSPRSSVFASSAYNLLFRTLLEIRTKSYTKTQTTRSKLIHYNIIKRIFHLLCQQPDDLQAAYENYLRKSTGKKRIDDSGKDGKAKMSRSETSCRKSPARDVKGAGCHPQPFEHDEIPFEDFRDLLLSLLGNFCLDSAARNQVIKHNGIPVIRSILFETESESIWRRCCRTLANLAVDPACRKAIQATDITAKIICIMESSCDAECKSTICRTLRLFADSNALVKTIIDCNGICILIQICRYGTHSVKGAAVKTLAELAKKNCSAEYGKQVLRGEGLAKLVEMTKEDAAYSENALCILIYLSRHNFMRPLMGSSDVIHTLQTKFESEIPGHLYPEILNAFCLFSYEALNRVKLRQFGILKTLLSALQDQRYASLHNRIISALVNFLYDDYSFDLLLEYGLVPVLLVHLQRCACFTFSMPDKEPIVEYLIEEILNRQEDGTNSGPPETESSVQETCSKPAQASSASISEESTSDKKEDVSKLELKIDKLLAIDNSPLESGEKNPSAAGNAPPPIDNAQNNYTTDSSGNTFKRIKVVKRLIKHLKRKRRSEDPSRLSKRYRLSLDVETDPQKEPAILSLKLPHTHYLSQLGAETFADMVDMPASSVLSHINNCTTSERSETNTTAIIAYHNGSLLEPSPSESEDTVYHTKPISVSLRTKCSRSQIEEILRTKGFCVKCVSEKLDTDADDEDDDDKVLEKQRKNKYCIDSPTYRDNITWQPGDSAQDQASRSSSVVKETTSVSGQCLSPLSNASYHSPDWSPVFSVEEPNYSTADNYSSEEEVHIDYYKKALRHFEVEVPASETHSSGSQSCNLDSNNDCHGSALGTDQGSTDNSASEMCSCGHRQNDNSDRLASTTCRSKDVNVHGDNCQASTSEAHQDDSNTMQSNYRSGSESTNCCSVHKSDRNYEGSTSGTYDNVETSNDYEWSATASQHDEKTNSSSFCDEKLSMANKTTEDNILILLSRISQKENPAKYLANVESFLCLLRYIGHVPHAFPRSVRILGRVVSNLFCMESLLNFMAPALVFLELMTSWNRRICDARCQDEMFWTPPRATCLNIGSAFSISSCIKSSDDLFKAGQLILNEFGVVAEINFGTCLLAQHLMKESPQQKYIIACLPFLCRSHTVQDKLLVRLRGFDFLQNIVMSDPQSCLSKVIMLGLSYMACHLNIRLDPIMPTPFPKCSKMKKLGKCSLKKFPKDITFVTDHGQKVFANKEQLTQQSDVFSAMLSSNFIESTSPEIAIPDISLVALRFIVHYLHGCSAKCCVIEYIVSPKSSLPFDGIVNVLAHADQYMLTKLQNFLVKIVREKYLNYRTAGKFYNIASLHNYNDLRKDCLIYCLVSLVFGSKSVSCMMDILTGPYAMEFLDLVKKTLKKHSTIDPFAKV